MVSPHEAAVEESIAHLEDVVDDQFTGLITEEKVRSAVKRGKNMKVPGGT